MWEEEGASGQPPIVVANEADGQQQDNG